MASRGAMKMVHILHIFAVTKTIIRITYKQKPILDL